MRVPPLLGFALCMTMIGTGVWLMAGDCVDGAGDVDAVGRSHFFLFVRYDPDIVLALG